MSVAKACLVCGDAMLLPPSLAGRRKTCSRPCQSIMLKRTRRGEANPNWKGRLREWLCNLCGVPFTDPHYVSERRYCSTSCRDAARRRPRRRAGGRSIPRPDGPRP